MFEDSPLDKPEVIFRLQVSNITEIYYGFKEKDLIDYRAELAANSSVIEHDPYDYGGAMYFAVAVILTYGITIAMLIGMTLRKSRQDDEVKSFLRSYALLDDRKYEKQRVRKALHDKNLLALVTQTSCVAAATGAGAAVMGLATQPFYRRGHWKQDEEDVPDTKDSHLTMLREEMEGSFALDATDVTYLAKDKEDNLQEIKVDNMQKVKADSIVQSVTNNKCKPILSDVTDSNQSSQDNDSGLCSATIAEEMDLEPWAKKALLAQPESLDQDNYTAVLDAAKLIHVQRTALLEVTTGKRNGNNHTQNGGDKNPLFISVENDDDYLEHNMSFDLSSMVVEDI